MTSAMICLDLKLLLYFANAVLLMFAFSLIAMGIFCSKLPGPIPECSPPSSVIGAFNCFLTIIGLVAVNLRQITLSIIYVILLVCLFGGQLAFGIKALTMGDQLMIKTFLKNSYSTRTKDTVDTNILQIHEFFKCCGFDGPQGDDVIVRDEIYISKGIDKPELQNATFLIRECCPNQTMIICTKNDAYSDNCVDKMNMAHTEWASMIGIVLVISCFIVFIVTALTVKELTEVGRVYVDQY